MGFTPAGDGGYTSEINVTPLVDVVLVLLIIFMVIVPLTLHGHDVDIPGPAVPSAVAPAETPPFRTTSSCGARPLRYPVEATFFSTSTGEEPFEPGTSAKLRLPSSSPRPMSSKVSPSGFTCARSVRSR